MPIKPSIQMKGQEFSLFSFPTELIQKHVYLYCIKDRQLFSQINLRKIVNFRHV